MQVMAAVDGLVERGKLAAIILGYLRQLKMHLGLFAQGETNALILEQLIVAFEVLA